MGNNFCQCAKGEFFRIAMFGSITFVFGLFVFGGFYRMLLYIGRFSEFTAPLTNQILDTVSTFILTVLFASTVITALSTQYLSEDLSLLVSSPVPLPALYASRLVITGVQSSWMVLLFSVRFTWRSRSPLRHRGSSCWRWRSRSFHSWSSRFPLAPW